MRRIALVLTMTAVVVLMTAMVAFPAAAQQAKGKTAEKATPKASTTPPSKMPNTGGVTGGDFALLGLDASALLIGGGVLVRRTTSR